MRRDYYKTYSEAMTKCCKLQNEGVNWGVQAVFRKDEKYYEGYRWCILFVKC